MTLRSVLLGLLGAATVCGLAFFNDNVLKQTPLVGYSMPASVYGVLVIFLLGINPRLKKWSLTGKEIAVVLALTLAGCSIPGGGLLRTMMPSLIMPHHHSRTTPSWSERGIVDGAPKHMLVDVSEDRDRVLNGYIQGLSSGDESLAVGEVPWSAWVRPLLFWVPLVLTLWIALIGLSVAVHKQWSGHERLLYPVARFTEAFLPKEGEGGRSTVRAPAFWVAAGIVLFIHLVNMAAAWSSDIPGLPTSVDFSSLGSVFPMLVQGGGSFLFMPRIYFIAVGIAFFIPRDVSFSFGVGPFLYTLLAGVFAGYGMNLGAGTEGIGYFALKPQSFILFGANLGVLIVILYTGRQYYLSVARASLGIKAPDEVSQAALWGGRAFMSMSVLFILQLWASGIDLTLALLYTGILITGFIVLGRLFAETGLIYMKSYFWPCATLWGILGARAIGPQNMLILMMMSMVLFIDPREAITPFMANSLELLKSTRLKIGRPAAYCVAAVVIGLVVAVPINLYSRYSLGSAAADTWADNITTVPYTNAVQIEQRLESQGVTEEETSGWFLGRIFDVSPNGTCMAFMVAGVGLVLACSFMRLRFTWWPLHPLVFVAWASTPLRLMWASYLVGWIIKHATMKYGGLTVYDKMKPIMMGLVVGDLLGALVPNLFGAAYFFISGEQPLRYLILPG